MPPYHFLHIICNLKMEVDMQANIITILGVDMVCNKREGRKLHLLENLRMKDISLPHHLTSFILHTINIMSNIMSSQAPTSGKA